MLVARVSAVIALAAVVGHSALPGSLPAAATDRPTAMVDASHQHREWAPYGAPTAAPDGTGEVSIPVYFTFVTNGARGRYPESQAQRLVDYANAAFAGKTNPNSARTPFRFLLKGIRYVEHAGWYETDEAKWEAGDFMRTLRVGDAGTLNVVGPEPGPHAGTSTGTLPEYYQADPQRDLVIMDHNSLSADLSVPGPALDDYANVFVHEIGHWLGLHHTFEGGCAGEQDDHVSDTPRHLEHWEWPLNESDTCPEQPGKDPIHNFMAYGTVGPREFTPGQAERMRQQWATYRAAPATKP
ncbi:M43 family zinc metalloprotease [Lentzea sp. NPDC051213]|uniref:M43 family zinc metalloprotease n=1 Tax=Lentzea sp. NPDC051213 TaxID=3364126 RepID=UPI0037997AB1